MWAWNAEDRMYVYADCDFGVRRAGAGHQPLIGIFGRKTKMGVGLSVKDARAFVRRALQENGHTVALEDALPEEITTLKPKKVDDRVASSWPPALAHVQEEMAKVREAVCATCAHAARRTACICTMNGMPRPSGWEPQ